MQKIEKVNSGNIIYPKTTNGIISNLEEIENKYLKDVYGEDNEETLTNKKWKGKSVYRRCFYKQPMEASIFMELPFCEAGNIFLYKVYIIIALSEEASSISFQRFETPIISPIIFNPSIVSSILDGEKKTYLMCNPSIKEEMKDLKYYYDLIIEYVKD